MPRLLIHYRVNTTARIAASAPSFSLHLCPCLCHRCLSTAPPSPPTHTRTRVHAHRPQLDSELLPGAVSCGINVPAPDLLTPDLLAAAVWSWAPGHLPPPAPGQQGQQGEKQQGEGQQGEKQQGEKQQGQEGEEQQGEKQQGQEGRVSGMAAAAAAAAAAGSCAVMRSGDGRWEMRPCAEAAWAACRLDAGARRVCGSLGG